MKERMNYITYLRVLAMLSVVAGHTAVYNCSWGLALYKIIFAYHIPLFVFISGFCFYVSESKKTPAIIKPILIKLKKLVMPAFVVAFLVVLPTELFITKTTPFSGVVERIISMLQGNVFHLWYLLMLFWIFIIFIPLQYINSHLKKDVFYIIVFGLTIYFFLYSKYLVNFQFYCINQTARYMYYFCLGILFAKYKDRLNQIILKIKNIVIVAAVVLVFCSIDFILNNWETHIGAWFIVNHLHSYIIISTILISAFYCFAVIISDKKQKVSKEILFLEKESLIIYYVHIAFGEMANRFVPQIGEILYLTPTIKAIFTFSWMMIMSCIFAYYYEKLVGYIKNIRQKKTSQPT